MESSPKKLPITLNTLDAYLYHTKSISSTYLVYVCDLGPTAKYIYLSLSPLLSGINAVCLLTSFISRTTFLLNGFSTEENLAIFQAKDTCRFRQFFISVCTSVLKSVSQLMLRMKCPVCNAIYHAS